MGGAAPPLYGGCQDCLQGDGSPTTAAAGEQPPMPITRVSELPWFWVPAQPYPQRRWLWGHFRFCSEAQGNSVPGSEAIQASRG